MTRIFLALAILSVLLLAANLVLGFSTGDVGGKWRKYNEDRSAFEKIMRSSAASPEDKKAAKQEREQQYEQLRGSTSLLRLHLLLGVLASLITVLVNSICVTYFIGTTRWCREVTEAYSLDESMLAQSNALKRKTFPWAVSSIVLILAIIALGSLSDPNVSGLSATTWRTPHYVLAISATAFIAWGFFVQLNNIAGNYAVISKILDAVRDIREQKGLDAKPKEDESS